MYHSLTLRVTSPLPPPQKRTQEIRKRKEMEHEMLSNPVKGFSGSNLNELGECACVITANQAMSAEEIEEVFYLVFPSTFVILAVGSSLSGYELKVSKGLMRILVLTLYTSLEIPYY